MARRPHPTQDRGERRRRQVRRRRLVLAGVVTAALIIAAAAGVLSRSGHHAAATAAAARPATRLASPARPAAGAGGTSHTTATHTAALTVTRPQRPTARRARPTRATRPREAAGCSFHLDRARRAVEAAQRAGLRIGFELVTSTGVTVAEVSPSTANFGGSITKAMLLVAFLRDWTADGLSAADREELNAMIEVSDNTAADWVYEHLKRPSADVEQVASDAGMTGFHLDTTDPVYVLGQSLITARDFARFFSRIQALMPASARPYAMGLLAGVQERVGLLAAGLPGVVYSKEGWKPESPGALDAPYLVNQAAQFTCGGMTYGIAVTVGQAQDQTSAQSIVQQIASALI